MLFENTNDMAYIWTYKHYIFPLELIIFTLHYNK